MTHNVQSFENDTVNTRINIIDFIYLFAYILHNLYIILYTKRI